MTRIDEEKEVVSLMIDMWAGANANANADANANANATAAAAAAAAAELKAYAWRRLEGCRFGNDKPSCKRCPVHCYAPPMRTRIREVMRYAGPRMLFRHPLITLRHLLYEIQYAPSSKKTKGRR